MFYFRDRQDAGQQLAFQLRHYQGKAGAIVLGLPRGGVPVAYEVAKNLILPLDLFLVRKLGVPNQEEFAMGAISSGGITFLDEKIVSRLKLSPQDVLHVKEKEEEELKRRELYYGSKLKTKTLKEKIILLIDDGIATGATLRTAILALKQYLPKKITIAVPVAPITSAKELAVLVDEFVVLYTPEFFSYVAEFYENFSQTTDEEVCELLGGLSDGKTKWS